MSQQTIPSDLLVELSTDEQMLISGGQQSSRKKREYECRRCYCYDCDRD